MSSNAKPAQNHGGKAVKEQRFAGGLLSEEDVETAFQFLDVNGEGKVSLADLKRKLGAFYRNLPVRDYKLMMNGKTDITLDNLKEMLSQNTTQTYDPIVEAFKLYDPDNSGYIDPSMLKNVFEKLGYGTITAEDVSILVEIADVDEDGRIGLADFRQLVNLHPQDYKLQVENAVDINDKPASEANNNNNATDSRDQHVADEEVKEDVM